MDVGAAQEQQEDTLLSLPEGTGTLPWPGACCLYLGQLWPRCSGLAGCHPGQGQRAHRVTARQRQKGSFPPMLLVGISHVPSWAFSSPWPRSGQGELQFLCGCESQNALPSPELRLGTAVPAPHVAPTLPAALGCPCFVPMQGWTWHMPKQGSAGQQPLPHSSFLRRDGRKRIKG